MQGPPLEQRVSGYSPKLDAFVLTEGCETYSVVYSAVRFASRGKDLLSWHRGVFAAVDFRPSWWQVSLSAPGMSGEKAVDLLLLW